MSFMAFCKQGVVDLACYGAAAYGRYATSITQPHKSKLDSALHSHSHSTLPKQSYTRWRAKAGRPLGRKAGWHLVFDCIGGVECGFDAKRNLG